MKSASQFLILSFLVSVGFVCIGCVHQSKVQGADSQKAEPIVTKIFDRNLNEKDNILSVFLSDRSTLFMALDPKPDIVKHRFNNDGSLGTPNRQKVSVWGLDDISFINSATGFAVGGYGTVLKTEDAGKTWKSMPRVSEYNLTEVEFLTESIGYVAGEFGLRNEKTNEDEWEVGIWRTDDGGNTWKESFLAKNKRSIFQIYILSPDIALASLDGEALIRTTDSGKTWNVIPTNGKQVTSFAFASDRIGWLVGYDGGFLKTIDGGVSWEEVDLPDNLQNHRWSSISLGKAGYGLAVSEDGIVAYSMDNGRNWTNFSRKFSEPLRKVQVNDTVGIVLGANNIYKVNFD